MSDGFYDIERLEGDYSVCLSTGVKHRGEYRLNYQFNSVTSIVDGQATHTFTITGYRVHKSFEDFKTAYDEFRSIVDA